MNDNLKQVTETYKRRVEQGESVERVIADLHSDGLTIIDVIKVVRELYSLDLKEANNLVSKNPAWAKIVEQSKPAQSIFADVFASSSLEEYLEQFVFGLRKGEMASKGRRELDKEIVASLRHALNSDKKTQEKLIIDISSSSDKSLNTLITLINDLEHPLLPLVIQAIRSIGYPRNATAIPWVIFLAISEQDMEVKKEAIATLVYADNDVVVSFFLSALLGRNDRNYVWSQVVNSMCELLRQKKEWLLVCGPAITYLLAQKNYQADNKPDMNQLMAVLEDIIPNCDYAIPVLYDIYLCENNGIGNTARRLLFMFNDVVLKPYRHLLSLL